MKKNSSSRIRPVKITKEFALAKCNYFVDVQLWPTRIDLDPEGWLSNFEADEMDHAVHLLYSFLYYSEKLVNEMFTAAFLNLGTSILSKSETLENLKSVWRDFVDSVIITYVTGETPSVTDSGYVFARKARQLLGIPETRIMSPEEALGLLFKEGPKPIVFVDDFVGSGEQFITTWKRLEKVAFASKISFEKISEFGKARFFYCPLLCTQEGFSAISYSCPNVILKPAHIINSKYSLFHPESVIWPSELLHTAEAVLKKASDRAGITGVSWKGYKDLGLSIAFYHSIPDATLPIIYWSEKGWKPLIQKS